MLDYEVGSIALLEGRKGKEDLHHRGHVTAVVVWPDEWGVCMHAQKENLCAPVAEVLQTCQAGPKDGFERIPGLVRERKVKAEVVLKLLVANLSCSAFHCRTTRTYQLGHRLLRFLLRLHVDAEIGKMEGELGIDLAVVASITIYV